ncbi:hypothetical protein FZEAL_5640 [Fusarium zealandicum]|uniref:Uncharacterized protein n=1 Tax=Fusarium zealandicum TaxID=1053134 RepID=A0A8H4UJA0_9HYPO|nr:hypothetical protein FZEAL_5640 [Fusarium zealandicum]
MAWKRAGTGPSGTPAATTCQRDGRRLPVRWHPITYSPRCLREQPPAASFRPAARPAAIAGAVPGVVTQTLPACHIMIVVDKCLLPLSPAA